MAAATSWSALLARWRDRDEIAVRSFDSAASWSGRRFLARAAAAAEHQRRLGPGGPAPALMESSPDALARIVGASTTDRPFAPLSPRLTPAELAACISALGAGELFTDPEWEHIAREVAARAGVAVDVLAPLDDSVDLDDAAASALDLDRPPDSVAFVLHTSGTTGAPKAVPYRHGPLAHRVRIVAGLTGIGPGAVYATMSPLHHIAGLGNLSVALAAGATVLPVPRFSWDAWRAIATAGVTHLLCVPTVIEMLLASGDLRVPSLRVLQYGASPIHPDTVRRVIDLLPGVDLINMFGQTEGSPITALTPHDHRRAVSEGRDELLASVGRPVDGADVRVDAGPDGVGEVLARAPHVFRHDDDGWLHTGDLGRFDGEGYLYLSGRRSDMIIRGGENVHPLEVEHVIASHPSVREAAVVGIPDQRLGESVAAFVVPADPARGVDREELRAYVRERLAGFKTPSTWITLAELPRNATGKIARRQLRGMTPGAAGVGGEREDT